MNTATEATATEIAAAIRSLVGSLDRGVRVLWLCTSSNREKFVEKLTTENFDFPVVAVIVRKGFENPNLLPNDFIELLESNREQVTRQLATRSNQVTSLVFLLLSRTELRIPQVSSPFVLPEWLRGGRSAQIELSIEDLTWSAAVPMNSALADVSEVSALIYETELAILRRFRSTHSQDHRRTSGILSYLRRSSQPDEAMPDILEKAEAELGGVRNKRGYRPSVAKGSSIVGRLWAISSSTPSEKFAAVCDALAAALSLSEHEITEWCVFHAIVNRVSTGW